MKKRTKKVEKKICTQLRIPMSLYKELKKAIRDGYDSQNHFIIESMKSALKDKGSSS